MCIWSVHVVELKRFLVCLPIIKENSELFLPYTTLVAERLCGGACVARRGICCRGCAWQKRRPLQRAVRILLECILVWNEIECLHCLFFSLSTEHEKKQFVSAVLMTQQEITDFSGNLNDFSGKIIIFIYYFYFKLYYCRGGSLILVLKM